MSRRSRGISTAGAALVLVLVGLAAVSVVYVSSTQSSADQLSAQSQQIALLKQQLQQVIDSQTALNASVREIAKTLPVVNQPPTIRTIGETWYLSPSAHQDRFDPSFIVVNQGDTVRLTLIDNDTVAHDFVVGPPYNIIVNATVPGLVNDLTGEVFTTNATNNSPGVVVRGTPGNVSASLTFEATWSGIYEFVCTYHAEVGMIGYLVVLPNQAFGGLATTTSKSSTGVAPSTASVSMVQGAGSDRNSTGYSPNGIVLVLGVNNTVTWTNNDSSDHTVTSTQVPNGASSFDSGIVAPGGTFTYTFTVAGTYRYHCLIHPWMTGTITIKSAG